MKFHSRPTPCEILLADKAFHVDDTFSTTPTCVRAISNYSAQIEIAISTAYPLVAEVLHPLGDLVHERGEVPRSQRLALPVHVVIVPLRPGVPQVALQLPPAHVLHYDEHRVLLGAAAQESHDVGVRLQRLHHLQLGGEVRALLLGRVLLQGLDGDHVASFVTWGHVA